MCETVYPSNNRFPARSSNNTTPKGQISARRSTGFPAACSGDIYPAVPRIIPASVARIDNVGESGPAADPLSKAFAKPKSKTLTTPEAVTKTFPGFKSR